VAVRLTERDGHEVHWLVQNPVFAPRIGTVHRLPFPCGDELAPLPDGDAELQWVRSADRGANYFGAGTAHYAHYRRHIARVIDAVEPDVVFGETTQFHELLALSHCRRSGRPYLFPTATRYPVGRMCFLGYDTMQPFGGAGEELSYAAAHEMIEAINARRITPSYMAPVAQARWSRLKKIATDRARITWGWLRGERYVTPPPWRKLALNASVKQALRRWQVLAMQKSQRDDRPYLLYPLQMQPESTIDVWGHPWTDQADIVRRAARAIAPLGMDLCVKTNPKPSLEISRALLEVVASEPNVRALPHGIAMREVFGPAAAILSVTGTVLIESVLVGQRALSLGDHALAQYPGVVCLTQPEDLATALASKHQADAAQAAAAVALLQHLHATSHDAMIVDPLNSPLARDPAVLHALVEAFRSVLDHLPTFLTADFEDTSPSRGSRWTTQQWPSTTTAGTVGTHQPSVA
jgi:hypothetical protein